MRLRPGPKVIREPGPFDLERHYIIRPAGWLAWIADVYHDARARWKR